MQAVTPAAANSSATAPTDNSSTSGSLASPMDQLANEGTFLKLLTAQIQNQDPLNPQDPTQAVGELVQFSELEQLLGINQGVQSLVKTQPSTPSTSQTTTPAASTGA